MMVFEIKINGEKVCNAGLYSTGVLSTIISWVKKNHEDSTSNQESESLIKKRIAISVGGTSLDVEGDRYNYKWIDRTLQVGDEINIKIVENSKIDEPLKKEEENPNLAEEEERKYYKKLKEKYGD